jgi:hypothetical protein
LGDRQDRSEDLFVVGLPQFEPWHFCAHLGEQAARYGRVDLVPTLLRWTVASAPIGGFGQPVVKPTYGDSRR